MTFAACALLLALAAPAPATPPDTLGDGLERARLNDYVDRLDAFGFSGQLMVEEQGRLLLDRSCGLADRRFGTPVTGATVFGMGSITKTFTAAAILRLESLGRLHVTDRVSAHLSGVPADKSAITLDQLLSHRAGLRLDADLPDSASREEVVRLILAQPLGWAPGEGFHYSNIGFDLLGAVVERASGVDYDTFVRREFLAPAGMNHTGRAGSRALAGLPAARGYDEWGDATALAEWPRAWHGTGAGRMVSNAHDLLRWAHALGDGVILEPRERDLMFAPHALEPDSNRYGYGMQLVTLADGTRLHYHGGDVPGYRSELRMFPDAGRMVVVVTNQDIFGLGAQRRAFANTLSRLANGDSPELPPQARPLSAALSADAIGPWQLPGGGRIEIEKAFGRLRLSARGQDAIDLFEADPRDSTGERHEATRRSRTFLAAAIAGDTTLARSVLSRAEFDYGWEFVRGQVARQVPVLGAIDSVECLGSTTLPFAWIGTRCYFRLHFRDGVRGAFLAWRDGNFDDATFGEERPAPTLLPAAALREGGYATFDMVRTRAVRFRIAHRPDGGSELRFPAPGGDVVAVRLR